MLTERVVPQGHHQYVIQIKNGKRSLPFSIPPKQNPGYMHWISSCYFIIFHLGSWGISWDYIIELCFTLWQFKISLLKMTQSKSWIFPLKSWWIFPYKSPFSHGFPMVFPWFSIATNAALWSISRHHLPMEKRSGMRAFYRSCRGVFCPQREKRHVKFLRFSRFLTEWLSKSDESWKAIWLSHK